MHEVKSESEVAQLFPTLSDPMDCSLPGSSIHGIFQAGVLELGAIAFSVKHSRMSQLKHSHHRWEEKLLNSLSLLEIERSIMT